MKISRKNVMMQVAVIRDFANYRGLAFAEWVENLRNTLSTTAKTMQTAMDGQLSADQKEFAKKHLFDPKRTEDYSDDEMREICAANGRKDADDFISHRNEVKAFMDGEVDIVVPKLEKAIIPQDIAVAHYSLLKEYL